MALCISMFTFTTNFPVITHDQKVSSFQLNLKVISSNLPQSTIPILSGKNTVQSLSPSQSISITSLSLAESL